MASEVMLNFALEVAIIEKRKIVAKCKPEPVFPFYSYNATHSWNTKHYFLVFLPILFYFIFL